MRSSTTALWHAGATIKRPDRGRHRHQPRHAHADGLPRPGEDGHERNNKWIFASCVDPRRQNLHLLLGYKQRRTAGRRDHHQSRHTPTQTASLGTGRTAHIDYASATWSGTPTTLDATGPRSAARANMTHVWTTAYLGHRRPRPRVPLHLAIPRHHLPGGHPGAHSQLRLVRLRGPPRPPRRPLLDASTGAISGTPTEAAAQATYTVHANASNGTDSATLTITVLQSPVVSGPTSVHVVSGWQMEDARFQDSSGYPVTWSISPQLPSGLALDASTGVLSGTPPWAGNQTYVVTATSSVGSDEHSFDLIIHHPTNVTLVAGFDFEINLDQSRYGNYSTVGRSQGRSGRAWSRRPPRRSLPGGRTHARSTTQTKSNAGARTRGVRSARHPGPPSRIPLRFPFLAARSSRYRPASTSAARCRFLGRSTAGVGTAMVSSALAPPSPTARRPPCAVANREVCDPGLRGLRPRLCDPRRRIRRLLGRWGAGADRERAAGRSKHAHADLRVRLQPKGHESRRGIRSHLRGAR